jgi:hypothetical protein
MEAVAANGRVKMIARVVPVLVVSVLLAGCSHVKHDVTTASASQTTMETSAPASAAIPTPSAVRRTPKRTVCPLITADEVSSITHQHVTGSNILAAGADCWFKLDGPDESQVEISFKQDDGPSFSDYAHDPSMAKISGVGQEAYFKQPDLFAKVPAGSVLIIAAIGSTDEQEKSTAIGLFHAVEKHLPLTTP